MKITSVECYLGYAINVKINTDAGISGFGEAGLKYGNSRRAAFGQCQDFAKLILGMDPFDSEKIWEHLHRHTFWGMGCGAVIMAAISAIDIACWDIKGKSLGVPVYKLLGGKTNGKIRCYASQIQFGWRHTYLNQPGGRRALLYAPEEYAGAAREAVEDGYDAVKVDPIFAPADPLEDNSSLFQEQGLHTHGAFRYRELHMAERRVAAIREAVGNDVDIIIENHALLDLNTAAELSQVLEPYRILYFEEPTQPMNPRLFDTLAAKTKIPLASGERIYTRWGFLPFFEKRSLSVAQPDICNTGGFTECKKICDLENIYDIAVQIHVCGGPIATAAALQMEAVIPNILIHEHHVGLFRPKCIASCIHDWQPENGYYTVSELPGIGQELSEEEMQTAEKVVIA